MSQQQLRHNQGKPKLSYFYANFRALQRLQQYYATDEEFELAASAEDAYDSIWNDVAAFLADGPGSEFRHLVYAFQTICAALEYELTGQRVRFPDDPLEMLGVMRAAVDSYCQVCVFGESKYIRGNYRQGAPITEYLDSALRHLSDRVKGELLDKESGRPHGAHALWNLWQALDQPEFRDDRLPEVQELPQVTCAPPDNWNDVPPPQDGDNPCGDETCEACNTGAPF